jgi:hypothetical protein
MDVEWTTTPCAPEAVRFPAMLPYVIPGGLPQVMLGEQPRSRTPPRADEHVATD